MATYTDNYNLIKPSYSEIADVATINTNMNTIDDIMHSSQVSLAPAYDSTQTYNTGDVVMYELLMYKCTDDGVTGAWNASKWERTTASECGDSGSDVEANPSGTATEELNKLRVDNTIYSIPEGSEVVVYGEASGSIAEFDDGSNKPMSKCKIDINAVQSGSGDPSPTNIRPISGWNGVKVTRAGKNLLDPGEATSGKGLTLTKNADGSIDVSGTPTGVWIDFGWHDVSIPAGSYILGLRASIPCYFVLYYYLVGDSERKFHALITGQTSKAITFAGGVKKVCFGLTTMNTSTEYDFNLAVQLELGSTASPYTPYTGQSYPVTFPDGQTVYGGTLNPLTGVLTVTHANIASYDGETLPSTWISDRDVYSVGGTPTTGAQVVYELATPLTYQLTPIQVNSLLGINNVWNDTNGETEVKYIRDLNTTINILWNAVFNQSNTRSLSLMKSVKLEDTDTKEVEEIEVEKTEKEVQKEIKKEEIND